MDNGSSIALTADSSYYTLFGENWTLDLNDQVITSISIDHAHITGAGTGAMAHVYSSSLAHGGGTMTTDGGMYFDCIINGTFNLNSAANYHFINCFGGIVFGGLPTINYDAAVGDTNVVMQGYSGDIEIQNMGQIGADILWINGKGEITINSNCVDGTIHVSGNITIIDNSGGLVTILDDARYDKSQINAEMVDVITVDTVLDSYATDGDQPTLAQAILAIHQMMQEKSISGTTMTVKKPDGSTTAMTFTLDDDTNPTAITRET